MQKIVPHLWFDTNAEEAVNFYTSVFQGGMVGSVTHYTDAGHEIHGMKAGTVLTVSFEIEGFRLIALNGGSYFTFTPAISFMVNFDPSREEDAAGRLQSVWEKLSEGGEALMPLQEYPFSKLYGWVKDKYGLTWQLILTNPEGEERPTIIPSLLFVGDVAGKAEEAVHLYTSVFNNSKKGTMMRYGKEHAPEKEGSLMFSEFAIEGEWFTAMDSAAEHTFTFNEAVSLLVECTDQAEIDYYWEKLSAVKESEQCGWLKDAFGVSWQIAPQGMEEMLNDADTEKVNRVLNAMFAMKKLDIAALKRAFEGE